MITDSTGRIYGNKTTACVVCEDEIIYTHKIKLYCEKCYKIRHTNEVGRWRKNNPEKTKVLRSREYPNSTKKRSDRYEAINKLKSEAGCMDCGYNKHTAALDFDHVRGQKQFNISAAVGDGSSWTRIEEEIKKCEIVCANCHRIRTFNRNRSES